MFNNSMQQRCSLAPPRFCGLQCLHLYPRRYKLVLHVHLSIISIFLYFYLKRKHSYQFASGIKPSSLSARVFAGNQSGSSLSYSVAAQSESAVGSSVYGLNRGSITSVSLLYLNFHESSLFHVSDAFYAVSELLDKQLFSDSKSDIVTNVFTDALVKIVQRGKAYPTR